MATVNNCLNQNKLVNYYFQFGLNQPNNFFNLHRYKLNWLNKLINCIKNQIKINRYLIQLNQRRTKNSIESRIQENNLCITKVRTCRDGAVAQLVRKKNVLRLWLLKGREFELLSQLYGLCKNFKKKKEKDLWLAIYPRYFGVQLNQTQSGVTIKLSEKKKEEEEVNLYENLTRENLNLNLIATIKL